jgi:hypothetical protein
VASGAGLMWDISAPISRTRILGFALQGRLCSVHAVGVFSSPWAEDLRR